MYVCVHAEVVDFSSGSPAEYLPQVPEIIVFSNLRDITNCKQCSFSDINVILKFLYFVNSLKKSEFK